MSQYFKQVDLSSPIEVEDKTGLSERVFNQTRWTEACAMIKAELTLIQLGTSHTLRRSINLDKSPIYKALRDLIKDHSDEAIETFYSIALQEVSNSPVVQFKEWLNASFEENNENS